jgi:hypothetical protein
MNGGTPLQGIEMSNLWVQPFSKLALTIGRLTPQGVNMLGTGFLLSVDGVVATTHHVIGNDASNLVVLMPRNGNVDDYQDLSDTQCEMVNAVAAEIDPVRDIAILKTDLRFTGTLPTLGSFDSVRIGDAVNIFGYPHCPNGRRAFTLQTTEIGSKVWMNTHGIKSKHAVINVQARPGQSGSPVIHPSSGTVLGMLIGAWVPGAGGISLGGINPHELHQTTHCISAEHIREML